MRRKKRTRKLKKKKKKEEKSRERQSRSWGRECKIESGGKTNCLGELKIKWGKTVLVLDYWIGLDFCRPNLI